LFYGQKAGKAPVIILIMIYRGFVLLKTFCMVKILSHETRITLPAFFKTRMVCCYRMTQCLERNGSQW